MWFGCFLSLEIQSVSLTAHLVSCFDAPGGVISQVLGFPIYTTCNHFLHWLVPRGWVMLISVVSRLAYQTSKKAMKEVDCPEVQLLAQFSLVFCLQPQRNNHPVQIGSYMES